MSQRLLVADSGPLIALGRLGLLSVPQQMFAEVLVTNTVWDEVVGGRARSEHMALHEAQRQGWLMVVPDPTTVPAQFANAMLDEGKRTALSLSLSLAPGCDVLIDERRGRLAAERAGLNVLGTLGLLVRARQLGLIGPVRPLTEGLVASGYHLGRSLVEASLASLGE